MEFTRNSIICTKEDIDPWNDERAYEIGKNAMSRLLQDGYVELPNWFPCGLPGYRWEFCGPFVAMKPKPKLKHLLRYYWFSRYGWWSEWKWNREKKRIFKSVPRTA